MRSMKFRVLCLVMVLVLGTATVASAWEWSKVALWGGIGTVAVAGITTAVVVAPAGTVTAVGGAVASGAAVCGEAIASGAVTCGKAIASVAVKAWDHKWEVLEVAYSVIDKGGWAWDKTKAAWDWFWDDDD